MGIRKVMRDITDIKLVGKVLSENKYGTLLENLPQKIFLKDSKSVYVSCNENYAKDLKIKSDEIVGKTDYDFYPRELAEKYRADDNRIMESGETEDIEEKYIQDGKEVFVHTVKTPVKDEQGNIVGVLGIFWDITDQKKAEEVVHQSEERYRSLVENIDLGITLIGNDYKIIMTNKAQGTFFNKPASEFKGKYCFKEFEKRDTVCSHCPGTRAMANRRPAEVNTEGVRDDGSRLPVRIQAFPTFGLDGVVMGFIEVVEDITERKMAEEALKKSEEKYRTLVDEVRDGYFTTDDKGTLKFASKALANILGYGNQEEIIGRHFLEFVSPEMKDEIMNTFTEAVRTGKFPELVEVLAVRKDSSKIFLQFKPVPIVEKGNIIGTRGVMRDITRYRKAQEALHESEEKYRMLIEKSPNLIFIYQGDAIKYANQTICDRLGWTREEMTSSSFNSMEKLIPPRFQKLVKENRLKREKGEDVPPYEVYLRTRNGTEIPVIIYDQRITYQAKPADQIILVDVSEHKLAEEALYESEEKYRQLVSSTTDTIMLFDADTREFIEVNKACENLYGYSREEFLNLKHTDITAEPKESEDSIKKTVQGKLQRVPVRYHRKKDGTTFPVEISASSFMLAGRRVVCGVVRDIAKRKQAEEKLHHYQEQLRSLVSELSLIEERERRKLATQLHDQVGQTLAITKIKLGALQELSSSTHLAESVDEISKLIEQTIQDARSLTFELSPPILYELGLDAAVEWLTEQMQKQYGIQIDFEGDRHSRPLDQNIRVFLFLAVRELLMNVVKHAKARKAKVVIRRGGNTIRVTVQDDGVGFDISKIRTGFGLFSIRERLHHLGGHLEIETGHDKGSRFTIVLLIKSKKKGSKRR